MKSELRLSSVNAVISNYSSIDGGESNTFLTNMFITYLHSNHCIFIV